MVLEIANLELSNKSLKSWFTLKIFGFVNQSPKNSIAYRHEILPFQLEKEKQFRFDHMSIGYVVKTEFFFLFKLGS